MGSFIGHVIPGSFFIVFALWWLIDTMDCYFRKRSKRNPFRSRIIQYVSLCGERHVSPMAWVVITAAILGVVTELILAPLRAKSTPSNANIQHAIMYFFFGFVPLQNFILQFSEVFAYRRQLEYVTTILAFGVEALLFMFHLDGRTKIDVTVHTMVLYILYATIVVLICEMNHRSSLILAITRSWLTMLQGTWFIQIAFTLYSPKTDPWGHHTGSTSSSNHDEHSHVTMKIASVLSGHIACVFAFYFAVFIIYQKYYRTRNEESYETFEMNNSRGLYSPLPEEVEEEMASSTPVDATIEH